jgi:hypothetical protein
MKYVNLFQVIAQISPLIGSENSQRQTNQRPDMYCLIGSMKMVPDIMDLGVAVMATGNAIVGAGGDDLIKFHLTIGPALFREPGLQKAATTTAAIVIRFVRGHFDDVFLADHRFDNIAQIIGDGVAKAFADDLARVLNGEFYFQILVPVGIDLQTPFADPFRIVLINGSYFKVVIDVEFFQSGPD